MKLIMVGKSVFTYFITEDKVLIPELSMRKKIGKYTILIDDNTPFSCASNGRIECAIYGIAVNVLSGQRDKIVDEIVNTCTCIDDVVEYERYLGGKYILLYKCNEQYFMQGDATCSIPIFYNIEGGFVCSSNYNYIVNVKNYCVDRKFSLIRESGDISQAMPYDITPYKDIKQLIPNHYLNINQQSAERFINSKYKQREISIQEATETVLPMIENILNLYQSTYKIYCPITAGRDSRVVLSFLKNNKNDFSCYTIKHPEHSARSQDIVIPSELCKRVNVTYRLIEDVVVTDSLKSEFDNLLGIDGYSLRTLQIAYTINKYFGDGAIINGDIIGQVGKCSLHRDIPIFFAKPSYFQCKLHNYSKDAKLHLKNWIKEIEISGEKINLFDLFSIENRMGRWAGQENLIYNSLGQVYLNIFNCRKIIYTWTAVERRIRKNSMLHIDIIQKKCKELLDISFEKEESFVHTISKANGITYLVASYMKYYIEKLKYQKGRRI